MTQVAAKNSHGWIWALLAFGILIWMIASCRPSSTTSTATTSTFEDPAFPYKAFGEPRTYGPVHASKISKVNLRSGPGTAYGVIGALQKGETIVALGTATGGSAAGWLVLRMNDGHIAYANHSLLDRKDHVQPGALPAKAYSVSPASFNCHQSTGNVEEMICQDTALAKSDRTMVSIYAPLLGRLSGTERTVLISEQAQWVAERDQCSADADPKKCISQEYQARIVTLQLAGTSDVPVHAETESSAL